MCEISGDGLNSTSIRTAIELPDSGGNVKVEGDIQVVGAPQVSINGSPLTAPAPPVSGFVYWIIQTDATSGAASIKQSTVAMPTPDPNGVLLFQETMMSTDISLAADTTSASPDGF